MWSRIARWLAGNRPQDATYSISDPLLIQFLGGMNSLAGVRVDERSVLGISAWYRAGALICGTIAGLPLRTLRDENDPSTGETRRKRVASWVDDPAGPGSYTPFEWAETIMWHLFIHSNAYLVHRYNGAGALVGMHPVHPLCMDVDWADTYRGERVVGGKLYTATLPPDELDPHTRRVTFDASTLTQVMGPTLDGLKGMSLLHLARTSLGATIAADRTAARLFKQGPLISGMVTPEEDVDPDEAEKIKTDLNARVTGEENAGSIAVINRKLKFQPWTMSLEDAQFLASRQFQIEEVARWTGVPPHLLMQTEKQTSWGTGVSEQNRGLRQFNLVGWTSRFEQRLSRLTPRTQFVEFDFAGLERGSVADEIDLLLKQVAGGLMTVNEARKIRNMPSVSGGDVLRGTAGDGGLDLVGLVGAIQKIYLGVGTVVTWDEARAILNQMGAGLDLDLPDPRAQALMPADRHMVGSRARELVYVPSTRVEQLTIAPGGGQ